MQILKITNNRTTQQGDILVRTDSNPDWRRITEHERTVEYEIKPTDKWLNLIMYNIGELPLFITPLTEKGSLFSVTINNVKQKEFGISFPLEVLYGVDENGALNLVKEGLKNLEVGEDPP